MSRVNDLKALGRFVVKGPVHRRVGARTKTVTLNMDGTPTKVVLVVDSRGLATGQDLSQRIRKALNSGSQEVKVAPLEVETARFRRDADEQLGRQTPTWIRAVADLGEPNRQPST